MREARVRCKRKRSEGSDEGDWDAVMRDEMQSLARAVEGWEEFGGSYVASAARLGFDWVRM